MTQDQPVQPVDPALPRAPSLFGATVLACGAVALWARLFSGNLLAAYDDDAFYYFQIARNLVTGHGSSFDGIHRTNGYHPLWMLTCVLLSWMAGGQAFFLLLQCMTWLCFVASFFAARSLFRLACAQDQSARLADLAASVVALQCLLMMHGGMEITLTLPLALALLVFRLRRAFCWNPRDATVYGALAALVVLSRLDSLLWILLLCLVEFLPASRRRNNTLAPRLLAAAVFALPLALYALSNHLWFHSWIPLSAAAKELHLQPGFTLTCLRRSLFLLDGAYGLLLTYPALLLMAAAAFCVARKRSRGFTELRAFAIAMMLFPGVQLLALCLTSDWPLWSWYLYSFVLAGSGAFLVLLETVAASERKLGPELGLLCPAAVLVAAAAYAISTIAAHSTTPHWTVFAYDLQQFAATHPGTYAMGDCAGTSGYLLRDPIVQTEGLVMDADFLENIRQQRDLLQVLHRYGVQYYVTFRATAEKDGCFRVEEPAEAGPRSPRMSASLCQPPVASYPLGTTALRIFDVSPLTSR